jgi:hypothetical protein
MSIEDFVKVCVIVVLCGGIAVYIVIILAYLNGKRGRRATKWAVRLLDEGGGEYTFGLPIAGIVTTVICLFLRRRVARNPCALPSRSLYKQSCRTVDLRVAT